MDLSQDLLRELHKVSPDDPMAALMALDKKRREEKFLAYWTPQEQQKDHFKKFTSDIKIFGILGGNRSGKTEEGAVMALAWALGKGFFEGELLEEYINCLPIPEPPNNIWVVGLDFPTLRDVIWREKFRFGRHHPALLPKSPQYITKVSDGDFQIFFENGSIITGKSADSGREKFQGASVDLVWIDEECEAAIFDEAYQRTADCAGKILLTLTPLVDISSGVRTPWVFDLYEDMLNGYRKDVEFVKLNVLENPYVPSEEKLKLQIKWAGHFEEKARLFGAFIQRSGLVYNLWKKDIHLIEPRKFPREYRRVVSIDPAATGTTAAVWAAIEPGTNDMYVYREYYESNKIVSDHAKNILVRTGGDPVDVWLLDPKWGTQRNNETHKNGLQLYRENGIPARLAVVGEDYGLNESREYIGATIEAKSRHPKVFITRDLKNFQFEIEHYVWDSYAKGAMKGLSKDKPMKRSDHLMNAFQYLCAMRPRGRTGSGTPNLGDEERKRRVELNSY